MALAKDFSKIVCEPIASWHAISLVPDSEIIWSSHQDAASAVITGVYPV